MLGLQFVRGLSLVTASGGHSSSRCRDRSSSRWLWAFWGRDQTLLLVHVLPYYHWSSTSLNQTLGFIALNPHSSPMRWVTAHRASKWQSQQVKSSIFFLVSSFHCLSKCLLNEWMNEWVSEWMKAKEEGKKYGPCPQVFSLMPAAPEHQFLFFFFSF